MKRLGQGSQFRDVVLLDWLRHTGTGAPYELEIIGCITEDDEVLVVDAADWSLLVQSEPGNHWRIKTKTKAKTEGTP
ncbi:MAG: hypothetical protein U5L74_01570 [Ideonella sp.]|nr:hypothetical protein [Ideonella sp.]